VLNHSIEDYPKISCLLVTAPGRFEFFKRSVKCYACQTYPNLELVVVNEGPKDYQKQIFEHLEKLGRSDTRTIFLDGFYTLGALRNISIALSRGDLFVQWDDDDFCTPDRLMVQFSHLFKTNKKVCFLSDQLHYYFPTKQLFWESWKDYSSGGGHKKYSLIPGTILAYKDFLYSRVRYPSAGSHASAGEDSVLTNALVDNFHDDVTLLGLQGYKHDYSFHGSNVWDFSHHSALGSCRSHYRDFILKYREKISKTLDFLELADTIQVMGRDGLAFIYSKKNDQ